MPFATAARCPDNRERGDALLVHVERRKGHVALHRLTYRCLGFERCELAVGNRPVNP